MHPNGHLRKGVDDDEDDWEMLQQSNFHINGEMIKCYH